VREHSRGWSRDKVSITTPRANIKTIDYKLYSKTKQTQSINNFFNKQPDLCSTNSTPREMVGGKKKSMEPIFRRNKARFIRTNNPLWEGSGETGL